MHLTRVIPCLLLNNQGALVKTIRFKNPSYVGDPINAVKIYNEKEVDELIVLDIYATIEKRRPPFKIISEIANECFMPLAYGGGVKNMDDLKELFALGVEKVSLNAAAVENPSFVTEAAKTFGSQSIIVSIDVKKNFEGKYEVYAYSGVRAMKINPVDFAKKMEDAGAGELLITSIDKEGTWEGFDIELLHSISSSVNIPVIANGGAGKVEHLEEAVKKGGASALALGSMVVYQKKGMGVLINFPDKRHIEKIFSDDYIS